MQDISDASSDITRYSWGAIHYVDVLVAPISDMLASGRGTVKLLTSTSKYS